VAHHAKRKAGNDIDAQDQERSQCIALHEFGRTIHRAVEIGLHRNACTALARFFGGDEPGCNIGINRHLLARQRIKHKARRDFGHAPCALGDDDHVDDEEDAEHKQTNGEIAADQKLPEAFDHFACSCPALVPGHQHHAGRSDIESQAKQGRKQQHRRKGREIERGARVQRHHQHSGGNRDVEDEEDVEQQRRDGEHHQREEREDPDRQDHRAGRGPEPLEQAGRAHSPSAFNWR